LEALCQAGAWLVLLSTEHRQRAALLTVGEVTMHRYAVPGDILRIHADVVSVTDEAAMVDGRIDVDGRPVLEASSIMCALIDAERLDDPAETARMAHQLLGGRLG
jgi:3-hydroxyacyl-[acyl-carrier-protein] dehydratase